jgi:hypothetical protein
MSTIHQDVANQNTDITFGEDAEDAFSKLWGLDAEDQPSKDTDTETDDEEDKDQGKPDDAENDDEAEGDDEDSEETPEDDEDAEGDDNEGDADPDDKVVVKHVVDGEEREFTLGHLKRLAGQEAALTRKSQEVANTRKALDAQNAALVLRSSKALEKARAKYEPLAKIDLLAASKDPNVTQEELVAARNAIQAAYEDVKFFEQDLAETIKEVQTAQQTDLRAEAQEAIKVLSDPEKGIEGWNEALYGEIRTFAQEQGLPAEVVNTLVNPAAIKLINMARLYAKGKVAVQSAKSDKKKAPKRIVKGTASAETTKKVTKTAKAGEPLKRLQKSGSVDDAADAFMAGWKIED